MKKTLLLMLTLIIFLLSMSSLVVADVSEIADQYDLDGETVTIMFYGRWDSAGPEPFEEGEGLAWKENVEDMFNCNIEFKSMAVAEQGNYLREQVLAGDKPADILHWQFRFLPRFETYDFVLDLHDVVEDEYWDRLPKVFMDPEQYEIQGKQYAAPASNHPGTLLVWNKDLLEREGLPNIYELIENDEWTWDKALEISEAVTKDTDGDGVIDQWGGWFMDSSEDDFFHHTMEYAIQNDAPAVVERDGRMVFNGTDPKFIEALEFFADERSDPPEGYYEAGPEDFTSGRVAFSSTGQYWGQDMEGDDEVGMVPPPRGPSADDYNVVNVFQTSFLIPITVENPRAKLEVATALLETAEPYMDEEESREDLREALAEDVDDRESLEWRLWSFDNVQYDLSVEVLPDSVLDEIASAAAGEVSATSAMEAVEPEVQAHLDDLFN